MGDKYHEKYPVNLSLPLVKLLQFNKYYGALSSFLILVKILFPKNRDSKTPRFINSRKSNPEKKGVIFSSFSFLDNVDFNMRYCIVVFYLDHWFEIDYNFLNGISKVYLRASIFDILYVLLSTSVTLSVIWPKLFLYRKKINSIFMFKFSQITVGTTRLLFP